MTPVSGAGGSGVGMTVRDGWPSVLSTWISPRCPDAIADRCIVADRGKLEAKERDAGGSERAELLVGLQGREAALHGRAHRVLGADQLLAPREDVVGHATRHHDDA